MQSRYIWRDLKVKVPELEELTDIFKYPKYLYEGSRFYATYYICPYCKETILYKTNTLMNFTVVSPDGFTDVSSVFTCPCCKKFYASKPNYKLAEGNGYMVGSLVEDAYLTLLNDIESVGIVG